MGKGVATIVIVLVLAAILIISVATFSPPEQASGTVQGSIFDRFLCLRYPSCPSGYVVNPASCRCVPRTTTTTTTTTATLTCACPSGYTPYQGYCAPNCFFETIQPPCTAAFIPCVRTTTTTTPICKCPDGYVQQGNNCISGPCYTLPCGSLAPISIISCPTTTTTTTTTTTKIVPNQYYLCTYANPNNAGLGFYLNGKFYMDGQLAPIIPNVVYNLSALTTVSNYRFSYWSIARTVNVTNSNSANTNVIFGTSGWDGTCVGNLGANYQSSPTCQLGTAAAASGVSYGIYKIYSDLGANNAWARIVIKDSASNTVDTHVINQGDAYDSVVTGLTIRVFNVAALQDGTVVGVTILVHPRGTCC